MGPDVWIESGTDRGGEWYRAWCRDCGRRGPKHSDPGVEQVEDWDHKCRLEGQ